MSHVKVKICGLTRVEDVKSAVQAGVDALGFVFTRSPRRINAETAIQLVSHVPENVMRIGLFMNQDSAEVKRIVDEVPLDVLQFHGSETELQCKAYNLPWLKAVAMENANSARQAEIDYPNAMGLLLDSHSAGGRGGSGKTFDWSMSRPLSTPVWLAGGLNAENVSRAIGLVKPYAVDVSSGVESSPGIKDASRMIDFIETVRNLNTSNSR